MSLVSPSGQPLSTPAEAPKSDTPKPIEAVTAFIAYQLPNGRWESTGDLNAPLIPSRPATLDDIAGGGHVVSAEATAVKNANITTQTMIQTQLAMARQAQAQQLTPQEAAALRATGQRG